MIEYIYFVKCMDCEDEPFDFFDKAKEFALSKLSKKPEIHQTEVVRNDFGECIDSKDYGKVWSWEEVMQDIPGDTEVNIFTKGDFDKYADGYNPDNDPEFDDRDITGDSALDEVPDNFRKPVPVDMTIDGLVEAMEENEEMIECKRCHELFPKEDCLYELSRGYLCPICIMDLDAAGEELEFRPREIPEKVVDEEPLDEEVRYEREDTVELYYDQLTVNLADIKWNGDYYTSNPNQINPPEPDIKEFTYSDEFVYDALLDEVLLFLAEDCITDDDAKSLGSSLEALDKIDKGYAYQDFIEANFEYFFKKYEKQILDYFKDDAIKAFGEKCEDSGIGQLYENTEISEISLLETLEDSDDYKKRLTMCPECGADSFDKETGICINCGFIAFD